MCIIKALIIGLGSMGKRRVRTFRALGINEIVGFDPRKDRREEAEKLYSIPTRSEVTESDFQNADFVVISTPPDQHTPYMKLAIEHNRPAFVEASVVLRGLEQIEELAKKKNVFIAPSCTMRFYPAIQDIKKIVSSGKYGSVTSFSYHSGQYLPDWHPWEKVKDFYVSKKETGGAREIVPYELTWMVDVLGFPTDIKGYFGKTMDVGSDEIDDSYAISLKLPKSFGTLLVDVVGRAATRNLVLNMEKGQILWNWDWWEVRLYEAETNRWIHFKQNSSTSAHPLYNKNIVEEMYIEENRAFLNHIQGKAKFPNTLSDDIRVLKLLERAEGN